MRGNLFFGSGALASSELGALGPAAAGVAPGGLVAAGPAAGGASAIPAVSGVSVAARALPATVTQRSTAKTGHARMDDPV